MSQPATKKYILFNAEQGAGKSTAAKRLSESLQARGFSVRLSSSNSRVLELTAELFNLPLDLFKALYEDKVLKETPSYLLRLKFTDGKLAELERAMKTKFDFSEKFANSRRLGLDSEGLEIDLTPREAIIYTSEVVLKPNFGESAIAAHKYFKDAGSKEQVVIEESCGFKAELDFLKEKVGEENILVLQLERIDRKAPPVADSREIFSEGCTKNFKRVINREGELKSLFAELEVLALSFLDHDLVSLNQNVGVKNDEE